ncbi:MarR family transcriptional regulator [Nocardioides seonyuensis]|uniref:MarR family transcriptional regulator n=1 Tax=Nocardioides seonyuensis TaxID=2518371 RepID=A0A4P7IDY3_9ACTN|nr:MarR family transcriptional regulator [Nocardioides seonyuensis]QBX55415.1 MarR family transcriptional regulator [Nocardioides seonyuensis]
MHSPEETAALDRVLHLAALVQRDLSRFERESGLTTPRVHLLWVLGETGPTTQQRLSAALGVTPRNVTGLVDGLVSSGHVTREPHPTDRRATLVTPTEDGARVIVDLVSSHAELAHELFGDLPATRLAAFSATLDQTIETFTSLMGDHAP